VRGSLVKLPTSYLRPVRWPVPDLRSERRRKREFLAQARELTSHVAADHQGLSFLVPTQSDGKLFLKGTRWEFVVLDRAVGILRAAGKPVDGTTFVDVGAFVGTTTIPALALHGFGRAVSVEPDRDNLRLLRANLCLNGLDHRATVLAGAASASSGSSLFLPGSRLGDLVRATKGRLTEHASVGAFRVATVTLDDLADRGVVDPRRTGLLWLDCQKQELAALGSARRLIDAGVPVVFALRRQQFRESGRIVARLMKSYEHVVNLRLGGKEPTSAWEAEPMPIEGLPQLAGRKGLTDVLLVRGLQARTLAAAS
jgi:FkbM family methyltransferase